MKNKIKVQIKLDILANMLMTCYKMINETIVYFKENSPDVEANLNFVIAYYDAPSEILYAEEISECRNEEGEIIRLIGTEYLFKKRSDSILIPDNCIGKISIMKNLDWVFSQNPKIFLEVYSVSNPLIVYEDDLKLLGKKKKPIFN